MNEQKFVALQTLAEDFSICGNRLFLAVTDEVDLSINITKSRQIVKMEAVNSKKTPIKRMSVKIALDVLKSMDYNAFLDIMNHMIKSVTF